MTIRAKHTLCSLKKAIYAHIWNTMFKNRAREKNSVLNHNLQSKRTCRRWTLSHVKCNTSEKVANQPNNLSKKYNKPFWNLRCPSNTEPPTPPPSAQSYCRKVFPECVGQCMKFRRMWLCYVKDMNRVKRCFPCSFTWPTSTELTRRTGWI